MPKKNAHILIIIVAALGYFVDIYDLVLFNVVKKESLTQIMWGAGNDEIKQTGIFLFNMQMLGMLIGGLLWGVWGDKKGRLSVLFGSIILYSLANIANAFTFNITLYAIVRIIAGIGLAGELGAGITLVSETMSKENRGYGTMIIVTFGALGAVVAALVGAEGHYIAKLLSKITGYEFANWQVVYIIGGLLGISLLLLRIGTIESGMFKNMKTAEIKKGDFTIIIKNRKNLEKYIYCILVGVPIWYIIGLLVNLSQDVFAVELNVKEPIINGKAVMYAYIGLSAGDLISGLLSQILRSRRKVVIIYLFFSFAVIIWFLYFSNGISSRQYYFLCFLLGIASGYWAIFVTIAAEQFGTNIRSTVTNTVPNFVRGSVNIITGLFSFLVAYNIDNISSALVVGIICISLALIAILRLKETFAKNLDYYEEII